MLNSKTVSKLSGNQPEWLINIRNKAFKSFDELPMPHFKYGIAISMDVSDLSLENFDPTESVDKDPIIEIEGAAKVLKFEEALEKHPDVLKEFFTKSDFSSNKLSALHGAFFNQTIFIIAPKQTESKIRINTNLKSSALIENIIILAEQNSKLSVFENGTSVAKNISQLRSQVIKILVHENAEVIYTTSQDFANNVHSLSSRSADVKKDGRVLWVDYCLGGAFARVVSSNKLIEEGAEANNLGVFFGSEEQKFDMYMEAVHKAPNTSSDILINGALSGKAKTIYRGLVKIDSGAKNSTGYQTENTLLLSEEAEANAVPNLEIEEEEVKCSHGTSIGRIDSDKLFYLMSRGISEKTAKKKIVEAFFEPILSKLENEKTTSELKATISNKLREGLK